MDELQVGQFTVRREQSSNRSSVKAINGRSRFGENEGLQPQRLSSAEVVKLPSLSTMMGVPSIHSGQF